MFIEAQEKVTHSQKYTFQDENNFLLTQLKVQAWEKTAIDY